MVHKTQRYVPPLIVGTVSNNIQLVFFKAHLFFSNDTNKVPGN